MAENTLPDGELRYTYEPKKPKGPMSLMEALSVLSTVHTEDDDLAGFVVHTPPDFKWIDREDYIRAWASLRQAIGLPSEPDKP